MTSGDESPQKRSLAVQSTNQSINRTIFRGNVEGSSYWNICLILTESLHRFVQGLSVVVRIEGISLRDGGLDKALCRRDTPMMACHCAALKSSLLFLEEKNDFFIVNRKKRSQNFSQNIIGRH